MRLGFVELVSVNELATSGNGQFYFSTHYLDRSSCKCGEKHSREEAQCIFILIACLTTHNSCSSYLIQLEAVS